MKRRSPRNRRASHKERHSRYCPARNGRTCRNWSSARRLRARCGRIGVTTTHVSATKVTPCRSSAARFPSRRWRRTTWPPGAGEERPLRASGRASSALERVYFGEREMRAADRHRVDALVLRRWPSAGAAGVGGHGRGHHDALGFRRPSAPPQRGRRGLALPASRRRHGTGRPRRTRRRPRRAPSAHPRRGCLGTPVNRRRWP